MKLPVTLLWLGLSLLLGVERWLHAGTGSADSVDFPLNLHGTQDPTHLPTAGTGTGYADSGVLYLDLRAVKGPSLFLRSAESDTFSLNLLGTRNSLTVSGYVYDSSSSAALGGVTIALGSRQAVSDATGAYRVSGLSPGEYSLLASKPGFEPRLSTVFIPAGASVTRNLFLVPDVHDPNGPPRILSITSKYPGTPYFLRADVPGPWVAFTAQVDWGVHPPGKVRFITSHRTLEQISADGHATQTFNMSTDFEPGDVLKVVAVAGDGTISNPRNADFIVMPDPIPSALDHGFGLTEHGDSFHYSYRLNLPVLDDALGSLKVPPSLTALLGKEVNPLRYLPDVQGKIASDGTGDLELDFEGLSASKSFGKKTKDAAIAKEYKALTTLFDANPRKPKLASSKIAGTSLSFYPVVGGDFRYDAQARDWRYIDLFAGFAGEARATYSSPFPIGPVPAFWKVVLSAEASTLFHLERLSWPLAIQGGKATWMLEPKLTASIGVGLDSLVAVEGFAGVGLHFSGEVPVRTSLLTEAIVYGTAGVKAYALMFESEYAWRWDYDLLHQNDRAQSPRSLDGSVVGAQGDFRLMRRPVRGAVEKSVFMGSRSRLAKAGLAPTPPLQPTVASLQTLAFPHADPDLVPAGAGLSLVWLWDSTNRTEINRTMLVHSTYDGTAWTEPVAVDDDGTADFHPVNLGFQNGAIWAAWESEATALSLTATLDQMKSGLEVKVAFFDPTLKRWGAATRLTTNPVMDRSPRLAGASADDVLVTWISEPAPSAGFGSTNEVWFSRWDGEKWSSPRKVATVPYQILKADLAYSRGFGDLVLSVDTDGDSLTVNDHELFRLHFESGRWEGLNRLTTDLIVDENPKLATLASGKTLLVWLKGSEISTATDFDLARREVVRSEDYTSNMADFRLARGANSRLGIVWAEASEFPSDLRLVIYDSTAGVWGEPKQLTHDAELERGTTTAFLGTGTLVAVYNRVALGQDVASFNVGNRIVRTSIPRPGSSDLYVLKYVLGEDLAFDASDVRLTPGNPGPGDTATASFRVVNAGDHAQTDVLVALYAGTREVARTNVNGVLRPGESASLRLAWLVDRSEVPQDLRLVIDPTGKFPDAVRTNNIVGFTVAQADLALQSLVWAQVSSEQISIIARVENRGSIAARASTLEFRTGSNTGALLKSELVGSLAPGESMDVSFLWSPPAGGEPPAVVALLRPAPETGDVEDSNNSALLQLNLEVPSRDLVLTPVLDLANGRFSVVVKGAGGRAVIVEASSNLLDWQPVQNQDSAPETFTISEVGVLQSGTRFYRARLR